MYSILSVGLPTSNPVNNSSTSNFSFDWGGILADSSVLIMQLLRYLPLKFLLPLLYSEDELTFVCHLHSIEEIYFKFEQHYLFPETVVPVSLNYPQNML